ncbi:MAG: hypothetical protein IPG17_12295 [Sandaracinaceae bacterium]|nr:hypothetical protein [Sandaracinaceae bacterium]
MTYRDDILALDARERAVSAELAIVDAELAAHAVRRAEASHLRAELDALRVRRRQASVEHLALHPLHVAKPCRVPWSSMQGGEHVRHCGQCNKQVYSLSDLSAVQVVRLLAAGDASCVRFFARADGTLITSDCSPATAPLRSPQAAARALLLGVSALAAATCALPTETPGEVFKPAPPAPIVVEEAVEATERPPPGDEAVPSYGPYTYEVTGYFR